MPWIKKSVWARVHKALKEALDGVKSDPAEVAIVLSSVPEPDAETPPILAIDLCHKCNRRAVPYATQVELFDSTVQHVTEWYCKNCNTIWTTNRKVVKHA